MADDGFEYEMALKDSMSGPARQEEEALKSLTGAFGEAGDAASTMSAALGAAGPVLTALAAGAVIAGSALGALAFEGTKFALESAQFKENASEAYAAVQGTAEEGRETYDIIEQIARTSHTPIEKAQSMASQLQLQGLDNEKLLYQVVQSVSDLSRVGSGQGAEKLQSLIQ